MTPKKLQFEPQDIYADMAKLKGKPLDPMEGYFRDNNGDWIVAFEEGGRFCAVTFQGTAKRGQGYCAPDPEGFANAKRLVLAWNAHVALVEALEETQWSEGGLCYHCTGNDVLGHQEKCLVGVALKLAEGL